MKIQFMAVAAAALLLGACADKKQIGEPGEPCNTPQCAIVEAAGSDTIYFGYDRYDLSSEASATLAAQAKFLADNANLAVTIEGHCDERGTREYNMALGERRANAVRRNLIANGVAADRIKVVSFGKERPVNAGHDEAAWAQNRRAVTIVLGEQ